jgi:uncharacterized protein
MASTTDEPRQLRVPEPEFNTARAHEALRILSLTGGGYRGLFTARVLVDLCDRARRPGPLNRAFDVIGGTSIGGLMACALAVGVRPRRVLDAIDLHGATVFPAKRNRTFRRAVFGTLYDSDNLIKAIDDCLGASAKTKLKNVNVGLVVPAVNWERGTVELFMSAAFGKAHASDLQLRDVCLATSAAPTYFRPHLVNGAPMLDGGLAANNPDALILLEVGRRWPDRIAGSQMLSIGTAGADSARTVDDAEKRGAAWAAELATYMMTVQERMASAQAERLLGKRRYLRVNHVAKHGEPAFENMDLASDSTRASLLAAAESTARVAYRDHGRFVDRILAER